MLLQFFIIVRIYLGDNKTATGILEHMEQKELHDWVSLQNNIGKTPLHLAAGQGQDGIVLIPLALSSLD